VQRKAGPPAARYPLSGPVLPFRDWLAASPVVAGREEPLRGLAPLRRPELLGVFQRQLEARHLPPSAGR
jgi:hypothetical protein